MGTKLKIVVLVLGDAAALYASLFFMLVLRYGAGFYEKPLELHLIPFTIVFAFWILIFYISGLYDLRHTRNTLEFVKNLNLTMTISAILTIVFFYLVPALGITPKTNLFIFLATFAVAETWWRRKFNAITSYAEPPNRVLLIGSESAKKIEDISKSTPGWIEQLGYKIVKTIEEDKISNEPHKIPETATSEKINIVVIPRHLKNDQKLANILYGMLNEGIEIWDFPNFYELISRKVPIADLEEAWFLENLSARQRFYDPLKRSGEFLTAIILIIVLVPLGILIATLVKLTSKGPTIYAQERVGKNRKKFTLYKFRTMVVNAEKEGARWAAPQDARVTGLGKFLRHTHVDELPQLWNVLRGNLSFVGPRPERPEFVEKLKEKIPYYEARLLIKPGITGWAQINHHADTTEEDVMEKLQYDIYYLKNRSPVLDIAIILKTIKTLFVTPR